MPEFLIGIRNLIDAIFNQMIDRGSITNNPPLITPANHDPDVNPFRPGVQWATDNPNAYRVLELPKNEQLEFTKIEFLLALVQKLLWRYRLFIRHGKLYRLKPNRKWDCDNSCSKAILSLTI